MDFETIFMSIKSIDCVAMQVKEDSKGGFFITP